MAFVNTIKGFFGYGDDDFEEDYDEYEDEQEEEEEAPKRNFFRGRSESASGNTGTARVVPIASRNERANVQIIAPSVFEDARKASEMIMSRRVVILNVSKMNDSDEAMRVVDFVSGTVYGLKGNMRKIDNGIFVAAPNGIDISGDNIKEHTYNNFNLKYDG